MIKTVDLDKFFRADEVYILALNQVNLEGKNGVFVAVMGPSRCDKSMLLNILGMLGNPTAGEYYFDGRKIVRLGEHRLTDIGKGSIGFVFQSFNLIYENNGSPDGTIFLLLNREFFILIGILLVATWPGVYKK